MTRAANPPGARSRHRGGALSTACLWALGVVPFSVAALCLAFFLGTKVVEVQAGGPLAEPAWQVVSASTVMGAGRDALFAAEGPFDVPWTVWSLVLVASAGALHVARLRSRRWWYHRRGPSDTVLTLLWALALCVGAFSLCIAYSWSADEYVEMTSPITTVEIEDGERYTGRFLGRAEEDVYVFSSVDEKGRFTLVMLHEDRFRILRPYET